MKCNFGKLVGVAKSRQSRFCKIHWIVFTVLCLPVSGFATVQSAQHPSSAEKQNAERDEVAIRVAAASAARDSGDPPAVTLANERLIAAALREFAELRSVEKAYPQAIELYELSLNFEDSTETRTGLAVTNFQAGHFDEAIRLAQSIRVADPGNVNADQVLGRALMQKGEYAKAVEPLTRVAIAKPEIANWYSLAICLLQTRQPEDKARAAKVFEEMQKSAGDSGSLHVLFGRAYRDAEDMPSAIREFERAVAIDPRTPHAHYFLGLAQLSLNEWKPTPGVESEFQLELKYYPRDYLANYMLGFFASAERRYEESNHYLTIASEINPAAPEPFLYLGLNAYAQDDMKLSEQMLRKAVLLTGQDEARSNYQIRRAYVDLGRILSKDGRKQESEVFLTKARELQDKTMEQSQQSIASIAVAGGGGMAAAVIPVSRQEENETAPLPEKADPFARIDPTSAAVANLTPKQRAAVEEQETYLRSVLGLAFNDLATSEAVRHEYQRALSFYKQAKQWDSSLPGLEKNLGQCAYRAGDYPEAIRGLAPALTKQPDVNSIRAMLGMSYFAMDQYAEAERTFAPLGVRGMRDGVTGYAWAASLARVGDMKKASEVLTAFASEPRSTDTLLLIGQLWTDIGDYAAATATLHKALQSDPSLLKAHFYAGLAYIRWEHWPEAVKEFQDELTLTPSDPDAQYHLGFVYLQQSKIDQASVLFTEVLAAHPNYANAQYQMGKILLDRGQTKDAVIHLEAAASLSPQVDYMHYQLQAAYRKEDRIVDADRELDIYKQLKAKSRERAAEAIKSNP
jgi:tetratricopeptide (TPR) repeat protein